MTTEELEALLEGGIETPGLDFKQACPWDERFFAKDILAMSNVQDGGYIVIGVKELDNGSFEREGIDNAVKATYQIDVMRDQLTKYADPHVTFYVEFPQDNKSKVYCVIRVIEFEEIPVVCRRNGHDVQEGRFYYRNTNRRVESAPISNSYDMQNIIRRSTFKMMQSVIGIGFVATPNVSQRLAQEREGL